MPQPVPSVSDSITYLQHFLHTPNASLHRSTVDDSFTPNHPSVPPRLPASLPASFLDTSQRGPPAPAQALPPPPSPTSVLSRHSTAQPFTAGSASHRQADGVDGRARTARGEKQSGALIGSLSPFRRKEKSGLDRPAAAPAMFRYASNRDSGPSRSWRRTSPSPSFSAASPSPMHSGSVRPREWPASGEAAPSGLSSSPAPAAWGQLPYERFAWRRHSASPHHGSSLLWGWGDEGHGGRPSTTTTVPRHSPPAPPADRRSRETAYEEVGERGRGVSVPPPPLPQRRPPLAPSTPTQPPLAPPPPPQQQQHQHVELTACHNPDEHAANMRRIARYLKNYYAREADEGERGVESLTADDVAGLAQCFYVDLYRTVRLARQAAGWETSTFIAEDPTENVIEPIAPPTPSPPPPLQREGEEEREEGEEGGGYAQTRVTHPPAPSPTASPSSHSPPAAERASAGRRGGDAVGSTWGGATVQGSGRRLNSPSPPQRPSARTSPEKTYAAAERGAQHTGPSAAGHDRTDGFVSPRDTSMPGAAATPTQRAPNGQLAYSGGGTHPVQIITARLPPFRNEDATEHKSRRPSTASSSPSASGLRGGSGGMVNRNGSSSGGGGQHPFRPSHTYSQEDVASESASLSALAGSPSPPYRRLTSLPPQQEQSHAALLAHMPLSYSQRPGRDAFTSGSTTAPFTSALAPAHAPRRTTPGLAAAVATSHGSPHRSRHRHRLSRSPVRHAQVRTPYRDMSSDDSRDEWQGGGGYDDETFTASSSTTEGRQDGAALRRRTAAVAEPTSGIVKRPLKDLMPLLRSRGTLIVKHVHHNHRPHLRLFQLLDCIDVYQGSEVLMPHFTWAAAERGEDSRQPRRRPRPKATRKGVPLPTGLSLSQREVPYETALNLTQLEAVYVGVGRGISASQMRLFHRSSSGEDGEGGAVVDHRGRPVAGGMCAVFVFASRPVAVTFLKEEDRQLWVGAMMGVVERNRTLAT